MIEKYVLLCSDRDRRFLLRATLCKVVRVCFDLHYAEIALRAICDFNYALMQIEMYRRRVVGHPFPTV